jgi:hypothetical protein
MAESYPLMTLLSTLYPDERIKMPLEPYRADRLGSTARMRAIIRLDRVFDG